MKNSYIEKEKLSKLRGILLENEPLALYTTWKVGGPASHLYKPADLDDLSYFLSILPRDEKVVFVGWGSNLLVSDEGFSGTVILTRGLLNQIARHDDHRIHVQAGVTLLDMAKFAVEFELIGLEHIAGIPGTVGGALTMNAGAYGSQTWDFVDTVTTVNRLGKILHRSPSDFQVGYRSVSFSPNEWFVSAIFKLEKGDKAQALKAIQETLIKRRERHPLEYPNAGSVFRNPPGDYSARLIEASGLKGFRIGGASVSTKHVNFIVNDQNATAKEINDLISHVAATIERDHGIKLLREVRYLVKHGILIDGEKNED